MKTRQNFCIPKELLFLVTGSQVSGPVLPEHQAEVASTTVAAAPPRGRHDAPTYGPDERAHERARHERRHREGRRRESGRDAPTTAPAASAQHGAEPAGQAGRRPQPRRAGRGQKGNHNLFSFFHNLFGEIFVRSTRQTSRLLRNYV